MYLVFGVMLFVVVGPAEVFTSRAGVDSST